MFISRLLLYSLELSPHPLTNDMPEMHRGTSIFNRPKFLHVDLPSPNSQLNHPPLLILPLIPLLFLLP